ncbi:hypothetical protein [Halorientalis pallida]|uniref:Uncharacterized protein n=1 Tax=Halorientalis pallida TaxID=2479928 RepID=A0A498KR90_9EURY|nr:hypothetical protein [Halorientalis pallida]RXK46597.1 hypothetical protein EAF64_18120 [Halorientalis pallida]
MSNDEWRFGLTRRSAAVLALVGALAFIAGVWVGLWSVPPEALDVPMQASEYRPEERIAYQPAPTWLPIMFLFVGGIGAYAAWRVTHPDRFE